MFLNTEDVTSPKRYDWQNKLELLSFGVHVRVFVVLTLMCLNVFIINLCYNQQQQEAVCDKIFTRRLPKKEKTAVTNSTCKRTVHNLGRRKNQP